MNLFTRQIFLHLTACVFFALFGAVYELFSHDVYSYYMLYAFAIPLVLGAFPCSIFMLLHRKIQVHKIFNRRILFFWNCGLLTLTVGCLFQGVVEIYGTSSRLIVVYLIAGVLLLATACSLFLISVFRCRKISDL